MPSLLTDTLAWTVVAVFGASAVFAHRNGPDRTARGIATVGWVLFAGFWLALVPFYAFTQKSYVEGFLSVAAVPACLYTGYLVWTRRPQLLVLGKAVAFMGLIYLPFTTIPFLYGATVETVTHHAEYVIRWLGYRPEVVAGDLGHRSKFVFTAADGHRFATPVLIACSGLGSIAIVAGLILAVEAPTRQKLLGVAIVAPTIYALNLVRVVFIVLAHGKQWFVGYTDVAMLLFASEDPRLASYFIADRLIAQSASVVALVLLTLALLRVVPALATAIEEAAYVATGREYDLRSGFVSSPKQG